MPAELHPLPLAEREAQDLGNLLSGSEFGAGYFDPESREVIHAIDGEVHGPDGEPVDLDVVDWIAVDGLGSRAGYGDMADFAAAVADPALADRLAVALRGRGAFRRFKDEIHAAPEPWRELWFIFRDLRQRHRALEWLEENDIVDEATARPHLSAVREATTKVLEEAAGRAGPQLDHAEVPARWPEVRELVDDGTSVLIVKDGEPWALVSPWLTS